MANITDAIGTDIAFVNGDLMLTPGGDLATISGLANLKSSLFRRLMTVPGSLVHRPTYGVGVGLLQNAPNSFVVQQKIAALIQEQFIQDPRVQEVSSISITNADATPDTLKISVTVKPVGYTEVEMTFTPFSEGTG